MMVAIGFPKSPTQPQHLDGETDSWTFDGLGNRLTSTVNAVTQSCCISYQKLGTNANNWQRLISSGADAYTYDANGSALTEIGSSTTSFSWDPENRLTAISRSTGALYQYDFRGRRTKALVGTASSDYLYGGANLIRVTSASPVDYLFGPGIDEPIASNSAGQTSYYVVDALESVTVTNDPIGTPRDLYVFDAWGSARSKGGSFPNDFGFTGREFRQAGTLFYRARYYQPDIGRFLSEDALRLASPDGNFTRTRRGTQRSS